MAAIAPTASQPYVVTWYENGEKKTMRRVPPPKLHDMLPTDIVELKSKRNDDFNAGDNVEIKAIPTRHQNTLQLIKGDGTTTFVGAHEVILKEEVAERPGRARINNPYKTKYISWP